MRVFCLFYLGGNTQVGDVPPVEGVAGGGTAYGWNDGGFHSNPIRGTVDPTKVPSSELLHVWCMPSTSNVCQQEVPRSLECVRGLTMSYSCFSYVWLLSSFQYAVF